MAHTKTDIISPPRSNFLKLYPKFFPLVPYKDSGTQLTGLAQQQVSRKDVEF
jgi:hypothetical protein